MNIKVNSKITMKEILIILLPFAIFVGPFIHISILNASNLFVGILFIYVFFATLEKRFQYNVGYIVFFLIVSIYATMSIIWSVNQVLGLQILFALITGFCTMFFIASFNEKELSLLIGSIRIFTVAVILLAVYEILTGKYLFFNNIEFIYQKTSYSFHFPGVVFINPNDLGYYLSIALPLIMILHTYNLRKKIVELVLIILSTFTLFNTESRLSMIGIVLILFVYGCLMVITNKKKAIKLVLSICTILIIATMTQGIEILEILNFDYLFKIDMNASYYTIRSSMYEEAFNIGLNYFPFGAGIGGSYSLLGIPPHNMFLFIWSDLGALICIGFVLACIFALWALWRMKAIKICSIELNKLLFSILLIFPILSMISSGTEQRKITWIFFGIVFASINISRRKMLSEYKNKMVKK
ncbi:O-antigen ligase [Bacillus sp. AFS033286]|uniref:O-antigen ligase family protein n=1 Tax=Bacillus sp. AFS033286 TaxID=2033498 RepID=UPI000BFC12EB|nr:O-antigen ligase family protein [Bacillus sp. AFS033286]PGX10515.1 hypothetical protein COE07_14225 [Bacillus sp. AFS033286]